MATATEAPASITAEGPTSHTQNQNETLPTGTHGYTREQQIEALHKLREPFVQSEIRYRPQPWCKACSSKQGWPKVCDRHTEIRCQRCNGQKITEAHICLKYVGHAEATNRLLNVDPFWDWEPLALDERGLPQYDQNRALWIRMTVCGMTRLGYGDASGKDGANAVKEIIGDAIRNAGMRFGMALDLWTSSDLEIIESGGTPDGAVEEEAAAPAPAAKAAPPKETPKPKASNPSPAAVTDGAKATHVDRLMGQVRDCWNNPLVLAQIRGDAEKHGVIDVQVQGPDGAWVPFRRLVNNRIAEMKPAQGGDTERSAA